VQFIANTPADVHLVFAFRFATPILNSSAYSAVTSVAVSAPISKVADINRAHDAKINCKKIISNYLTISNYTISLYLFFYHGIQLCVVQQGDVGLFSKHRNIIN
jgi:hypothetical protein